MSAADSSNILNRLELSHNLRGSLQRAAGYAHQQSHREVTLEHLLLALAEDRDAAVILEASNVDISGLVTEVSDYLGRLEDRVVGEDARQPTLGRDLIHICQSAAAAAQKSQRRAIGSALVLAAIVGEGRSPSAQMLRNHGLTFEQAIQALRQANTAQAARPVPNAPTPSPPPEAGEAPVPEHEVAPHPPGGEQVSEMPAPAAPDLQPRAQGAAAQGEQAREATPGPTSLDPRISGPIRQVQAARDILAGARERVAAAGGAPAKAPQADEAPSPATPASTPLPQPPAEAVTVAPEPDRARQEPPSPAAAGQAQQDVTAPKAVPRVEPADAARSPAGQPPRQPRPDPLAAADAAVADRSRPPAAPTPPRPEEKAPRRLEEATGARSGPPPAPPSNIADRAPPGPPPKQAERPRAPAPPSPNAPPPPVRPAPTAEVMERQPPLRPPVPERDDRPVPHQPPARQMPPSPAAAGQALPSHPDELRPAHRPPPPARAPHLDWPSRERPMPGGEPGQASVGKHPPAPRPAPPPAGEPGSRDFPAMTPEQAEASNFDPKALVSEFPKRMRVGKPVTVGVRVPRHQLEAWSGGGSDPATMSRQVITKAMMMRLKAAGSGFTVENASPETQWSQGYDGPLSDDIVSWRWIVTPHRSGRQTLQLNGATRVVGRDGLAAERPLPPQRVTIRVSPNYLGLARRLVTWGAIAATAGALGYFADGLFDMGRSVLAQLVG